MGRMEVKPLRSFKRSDLFRVASLAVLERAGFARVRSEELKKRGHALAARARRRSTE